MLKFDGAAKEIVEPEEHFSQVMSLVLEGHDGKSLAQATDVMVNANEAIDKEANKVQSSSVQVAELVNMEAKETELRK